MYLKIIDAVKPTTTVIVFNRLTSSLDDIVDQIEALPSRAFTSIGLVQDGTDRMMDYRIVEGQEPCALQGFDLLASWSPVITFLQSLQSLTGMATFDFISCLLGANPGFSYAISQISAQLGVVLQASTDRTGNLAQGGNWIQESDAVNIQDVYFTEAIAGYTELLFYFVYRSSNEMITQSNTGLVSAVNPVLNMKTFLPATIYTWGSSDYGGVGAVTGSGYTAIASNAAVFAALNSDTTIYTWGVSDSGGIGVVTGSGYTAIASTANAFAALKSDGTIYAWGSSTYGGIGVVTGSGYTAIASNSQAFAALKSDGTIYAWGSSSYGGIGVVTGSGYTSIASNNFAFAAMTSVAIASSGLACFVKGTRLLSQNGYKPIEQFNHTDLLITSDGRTVDFKLCKTTIAKTDEDTAPYVIQAHAFGHNSPIAPLYLSPTHKVMIKKGVWVSPKDVAETNPLVKRCAIGESVTYYHVKCENYLRDNVIAEGIVSESYGTADAVKGVKDIFKWNSRLGGYTRKGPQALLKNKIL